ncbi:Mpv17 / PMP22 family [Musa troglodytarum]|uniref:Mpv17 / PMP22 family n=1 Tax=Musa troglodytarum TaxID=320322 RepID=A0A9E7H6L0_9LILI|nr:Mpv17 / PMP22 family [Musa troglodytarum]
MLKLWRWYQNCLAVHPVRTQMVSSAFLWGLGDIGAQVVTQRTLWHQSQDKKEENKEINIDWRRVATTSMFGFAFVGPIGHYWYEYLDRIIQVRLQLQPKSMKFVTSKVAADGLIFGPLDLLIFFSYMGLTSGRSISQVKEDVKRDFLPALIVGGTVWPIVQVANFRFVPVRYQLLYVNLFCLLDSSFLSWIEQQGDAPWKQWFTSVRSLENKKSQS